MSVCSPHDTLREHRPHTVFMDAKPMSINCPGEACQICRGATAIGNWKEIERMIQERFRGKR